MELRHPRYVAWPEVAQLRQKPLQLTLEGLWVAGSLAGLGAPKCAAIVGSRAPSAGARQRAYDLAAALVKRGVCVISGLAHGIDAAAHEGALAGALPSLGPLAGGTTIGVLGGGHRNFYPPRNEPLARAIVEAGGAVVSPYPPDMPAQPHQFLERNAIIADLADVVVVVEAAARSGAISTASWASKHGVDCVAFPGDVDRPGAAGCNALIRDGVTLVRDAADVFEALGIKDPPKRFRPGIIAQRYEASGDAPAAALIRALGRNSLEVDALVERTGASASEVLVLLVRLELDGVVRRDGTRYTLCEPAGR